MEHLKSNIDALEIDISEDDLKEIDDAENFDHGFLAELIFGFHGKQKIRLGMSSKDIPLVQTASHLEEPGQIQVSWRILSSLVVDVWVQAKANSLYQPIGTSRK